MEAKVLLAVIAASAMSEKPSDSDVRRVFDRKLGAGWAFDFLNMRSDDERVAYLNRRLRLSEVEIVANQTSFEDGGAR